MVKKTVLNRTGKQKTETAVTGVFRPTADMRYIAIRRELKTTI
jgi:hypothetical protein